MSREAIFEAVFYFTAALFFVFGFGVRAPAPPSFHLSEKPAQALRVMTWNVGGSSEAGEWGIPLLDEHVEHVVQVLNEIDPDLCFLQEVRMGRQAREIVEALGNSWSLEFAQGNFGRKVIALSQRGSIKAKSLGKSLRESLGLSYSPTDGPRLFIAGLHADVSSAKTRNEEVGAIVEFLNEWDDPVILVGDLNIDLDLDKRRDLFTDNEYLDVETYNFVASHLLDTGRGTGSTAEPDRRLDYVFVEEQFFDLLSAGPLKNRRIANMDHDPVVADLLPK